jgi:hypothetical protein
MNAYVLKFASGDYASQSQELLNELARAMLCLTDATRKREYDASLGRTSEEEGARRSFEEILLANKVIDREQLAKARSFAEAVGLEVRDAVLQQKMAPASHVMVAYAESVGLPYIELADLKIDQSLAPQVPPTTARQHSCVPVMIDDGTLLVASPNFLAPEVEEDLRLRFGVPVRTVLCTAANIHAVVGKFYPRDAQGPAPGPPGKKPAAAKPKPQDDDEPVRALSSEEQIRRRTLYAVIGFNITIILAIGLFTVIRGGLGLLQMGDFVTAAGAGLLVAGAAFGLATLLKF